MNHRIYHGDNLEILKAMPDNSVDAVATDPPYGLSKEPNIQLVMKDWLEKGYHEIEGKGFMGKEWDKFVPQPVTWREIYRVLKPGGYMLVACGTRTQDWMVSSIRFAGFEVRDVIGWIYSSGFPKNMDIAKAIDKQAGVERKTTGEFKDVPDIRNQSYGADHVSNRERLQVPVTEATSEEAIKWKGWGTALKPAMELWTLCRKPISEDTIADNVIKWGTGGLNIDASRIPLNGEKQPTGSAKRVYSHNKFTKEKVYGENKETSPLGRHPANVIHDGSDEVVEMFPITESGMMNAGQQRKKSRGLGGYHDGFPDTATITSTYGDSGSAARFFYCAKASDEERGYGNDHPTVKPLKLMQYLVKLIAADGATVLDPFMGSGTTGLACRNLGLKFIGIEQDHKSFETAKHRLESTLL